MLFEIIFCYAIALVTGGKITYTKESWTTDAEPCITDCIDKKCIARWGDAHVSCVPGDTPALTYYTTRKRPPHSIWCISRCGVFNKKENDNRCYISDYDWDNCNPQRGTTIIVDKAFTIGGFSGPCKDDCGFKNKEYLWCWTYDDSWDYCELEGHTYVQSHTVDGLVCPNICGQFGTYYNLCRGAEKKSHICAPPARDFSMFSKMSDECVAVKECAPCSLLRKQEKNRNICVVDTCQNGSHNAYVSDYVKLLERTDNYLVTQNVNETGNPIYRYTIMPPILRNDPKLPLLVRARVTGATLRSPKSDNRNSIPGKVHENVRRMGIKLGRQDGSYDGSGRLIGYMLGGPDEIYNFVPQSQRLLRGQGSQWFITENKISEYIHQRNGWAEISVLVLYKDLPYTTRPDGFVVNVALYDSNNILDGECNNSYYSNDS